MRVLLRTPDARSAVVSTESLVFYRPWKMESGLLNYGIQEKNTPILTQIRKGCKGCKGRKAAKAAKRCVTVQCDHAPTVLLS